MDLQNLISIFTQLFELRTFIILGLILQSILILLSPIRKKTSNSLLSGVIWVSYTLATVISSYLVGLISFAAISKEKAGNNSDQSLVALWAPYILLQVVGPDSITATSMDDNNMWSRSAFQFFIAAYVLHRSIAVLLPRSRIGAALYLAYFAAIIKCISRTRSLYLGKLSMYRSFSLPIVLASRGPNSRSQGGSKLHDPQMVRDAFYFFQTFKGIYANVAFSPEKCSESREYFLRRDAKHAFAVAETEMNFAYDLLYTKTVALRWKSGFIVRMVAVAFEMATLFIWLSVDKHGFSRTDVGITWTLVLSAVAFDAITITRLLLSDWTIATVRISGSCWAKGFLMLVSLTNKFRCGKFLSRRWSESMAQYSFIKCCTFPKYEKLLRWWKIKDWLHGWRYIGSFRYAYETKLEEIHSLRGLVFDELVYRAGKIKLHPQGVEKIFSARGDWILSNRYGDDRLISVFVSRNDKLFANSKQFENTVFIWHIATELCYNSTGGEDDHHDIARKEKRKLSKVLSDYMLYLVLLQPDMIFGVTSDAKMTFQDACDEAQDITSKTSEDIKDLKAEYKKMANKGCGFGRVLLKGKIKAVRMKICARILKQHIFEAADRRNDVGNEEESENHGLHKESVLEDACKLAKELEDMMKKNVDVWKVISEVWVELLCSAACNSSAGEHAAQLCKGGQLVTLVWLLMAHLGLGKQLVQCV